MMRSEILRFILGFKVRHFRLSKSLSSRDLAKQTGMSPSYLNEIEKGKKYPKVEKIMELATALKINYDDLVSLNLGKELKHLTEFIDSPLIQEFPFEVFGIVPRDLLELITNSPERAGALLGTILEIARSYDMGVEQFYLASLRSYQEIYQNYFEEIEDGVSRFLKERHWKPGASLHLDSLKSILSTDYGVSLKEVSFEEHPELQGLRSVWIEGDTPKLLVNEKLLPSQKAFEYGREIGFRCLNIPIKHRNAAASLWQEAKSFDQVLSYFQASYFSGALLINRDSLVKDLKVFFKSKKWNEEAFAQLLDKYHSTGEMFLYRLSEILPKFFGLNIHYHRFNHTVGTDDYQLTKHLSMSELMIPHGTALQEKFCRRWLSLRLLSEIEIPSEPPQPFPQPPKIAVQLSRVLDKPLEYFCITIARPLALSPGKNTSITLGFRFDDQFKKVVNFWNDPDIPQETISETCERCRLSPEECSFRASPPTLYNQEQIRTKREKILAEIIDKEKNE